MLVITVISGYSSTFLLIGSKKEQPAVPQPLAEPPEQLPEVPAAVADVPVAPPAALPHTARQETYRCAVCGRVAGGATGTSATQRRKIYKIGGGGL